MNKYIFLIAPLLLFWSEIAISQVTISPTAVFLDRNNNVGSLYISNPSNSVLEVRISFEFFYPTTDDSGRVYMRYDDHEAEEQFSLSPYLRAFPTTFSVQPGGRQTVRLIGRIPQDAADGLYWSRMRISSNQITPPIGDLPEGQVAAQVSFQIDQITAVLVHHGDVNTGLLIHNSEAVVEGGNLSILTDVERTGNSAFIGSVNSQLINSNGQVIDEKRSSASVYFRNLRRVDFDVSSLPSGTYTVVTTYESARNDISSQNIIQIPQVTERTTFTIE